MADGIQITAGSGTTVATDDVSGVHYQRVKQAWGADGTAADVSDAAPLPATPGASAAVVGVDVVRLASVAASVQTGKASAGNLYGLIVEHNNVDSVWVQIFDTAGNPTLGSDTPAISWSVPPGDGDQIFGVLERQFSVPLRFASGIKLAVTTTQSGATAPANAAVVHVLCK